MHIYIDIGQLGGYCISNNQWELIKIGSIDTSSELKKLKKLIEDFSISKVIFEKPFGIQGNRNMNTFINYGRVQAVPMMLDVEFVEVSPKEWVSFYSGIKADKVKHSKKAISILKKMRFDTDIDLIKKDGVADAILIYNYFKILDKYKG